MSDEQLLIPPPGERIYFRALTLKDTNEWRKFILSKEAMAFFNFPMEEGESERWIQRQLDRYAFLPEHWGRGYATEAASICYHHGFKLGLADFIVSVIHEKNVSSQRVAERNGLYIWKRTTWKELPVQVWRTDISKDQ